MVIVFVLNFLGHGGRLSVCPRGAAVYVGSDQVFDIAKLRISILRF